MPIKKYKIKLMDGREEIVFADPEKLSKKEIQLKGLDQADERKLKTQEADDIYEASKTPLQRGLENVGGTNIGSEIYGGLETAKTLVSGIPAGLIGMLVEEGLKAKNKLGGMSDVEAGVEAKKSASFINKAIDIPESKEGKRNVEAIGDFFEDAKIPAISPLTSRLPSKSITKTKKPLKERKTQSEQKQFAIKLYKEADEAGAVIKKNIFKDFAESLKVKFEKGGFRGSIADQNTAKGIVDEIAKLSKQKGGVTLEQLQTLRTLAGDAASHSNNTVSKLGLNAMTELDKFTMSIKPIDLIKGSNESFSKWRLARTAWGTQAKMKEIAQMKRVADFRGSKTGTEMDKFQQLVLNMVINPKRTKLYSRAEIEALEMFAKGGKLNKTLNIFSQLAPKSIAGGVVTGGIPTMVAQKMGIPFEAILPAIIGGYGTGLAARQAGKSLLEKQSKNIDNIINVSEDFNFKPRVQIDPTASSIGLGLLDDVFDERDGTNERLRSLIDSLEEIGPDTRIPI